jgi:serine/threonine protein kinase/tetratricopeptide (TPR) repeat protein
MNEALPDTLLTPSSQDQPGDETLVPITPLLEEQRLRWQKGDKVLVEGLLAQYPALQGDSEGVVRLIQSEMELRRNVGERPRPEEYLGRFPQFASQLGLRLTKPATEADSEIDDTLNVGQRAPTPSFVPPPSSATTFRNFADYEVQGVLGRGGMGVVYKAWQKGLNRPVALKMILASEHAGSEHLARFRMEAEAAARLQHPNVTQIYEVGETNGHPFLALEYVEGGTLADKMDGTPQPPRPAAELLETLARAMHHAHERGIVHRDLKPANVLLLATEEASQGTDYGVPKITDFGLAKRLDVDVKQTQSGAILGTPCYMAPEQAAGKVGRVGPATDVYSLGAILYDLLTGRPPFKSSTLLDTLEQVKTVEPVPPARLEPKVPSDLQTICLKCLRKEPEKRYASAKALADDLRRFLNGEPIEARPTPVWERVLKWSRRRPAAAALVVVSILAIIGLLVGSGVYSAAMRAGRDREANLRRLAEDNFRRALDAIDEMLTEVGAVDLADVPQMEETRAKLLTRARDLFQKFPPEQSTDPAFQQVVARAYGRLGDIETLLNRQDEALAAYTQAIALGEQFAADSPADAGLRRELGRNYNNLGILLKNAKKLSAAEQRLNQALALRDQLASEFPDEPSYSQDLALSRYYLGAVLAQRSKLKDAEIAYHQALDLQEKLARRFPQESDYLRAWARTLNNLGKLLKPTKRKDEAAKYFTQAVDLQKELADTYPRIPAYRRELADSYNNLAIVVADGGRVDQAEATFRLALDLLKQLSFDFPRVPEYRYEWAVVYRMRGEKLYERKLVSEGQASFSEALKLLLDLWALYPKSGSYRQELAHTYQSLAKVRPVEAQAYYSKALALRQQLVSEFPENAAYVSDLGLTLNNRAVSFKQQILVDLPLEMLIQSAGPNRYTTIATWLRRKTALAEALAWQTEGVARNQAALDAEPENGQYRGYVRQSLLNLFDTEVRLGNPGGAAAVAEQFPKLDPDDDLAYRRAAEALMRCLILVPLDAPERPQAEDEYGRRAVEFLRQAVSRGFKKVDDLMDPLYDPIRKRADFKELQKQLEKEGRVGVG